MPGPWRQLTDLSLDGLEKALRAGEAVVLTLLVRPQRMARREC